MINKTFICTVTAFLLLLAGNVGGKAQDAFVATWNFSEGDLSALHGEDMEYMGDGEVSTADLVQFGATDALGISAINEEIAMLLNPAQPQSSPHLPMNLIVSPYQKEP